MRNVSTRRLCRAGIIAALYVALTYIFAPFAFGPIQVRPAEALCMLPLFFNEAVPSLWIGCILSNLGSPYMFYDVVFGSLATLLSALGTYITGVLIKKDGVRFAVGGTFPVFFNALIIPFVIVFLCGGDAGYSSVAVAYFSSAASIAFTETIWVYGLGVLLYALILRLRKKSVRFLY